MISNKKVMADNGKYLTGDANIKIQTSSTKKPLTLHTGAKVRWDGRIRVLVVDANTV